jgi:CO/xanthine dehydrogenase Mo-binding subunit
MSFPLLSSRVCLTAPGQVTVRTGKVELGQGIVAALTRLAAADLEVDPRRIQIPPVSTLDAPNEGHTAGSLSIQTSGVAIGQACRLAKRVLTAAVASRLGVAAERLQIDDGRFLLDGSATDFDYWSVKDALDGVVFDPASAPEASAAEPEGDVARVDLQAVITGAAFLQDLEFSGLIHARVVRPPEHGARLEAVNVEDFVAAHPDVQVVVDGEFLAVACDLEEDAVRAAERLRAHARWRPPNFAPALGEVTDWLPALAASTAGTTATSPRRDGSLNWHGATYSRPAIAHGSIGPSCAIAQACAGRLDIWTHSQNVFALREAVAGVLGLDPATVMVTHVRGSGCYGHNGADDAALDAAIVALRVNGRPVRMQWSREEELAWAPVGAPMVVRIDAGLTSEGLIGDWNLELWTTPHARRPGVGGANLLSAALLENATPLGPATEIPLRLGGGGDRNAAAFYNFPAREIVCHFIAQPPIRTSSLRSLGAHCNIFAIESMMDELAALAGVDPREFRLRHLSDARARRVIDAATELCGWEKQPEDGIGRGLAVARYKNTSGYAAVVAEVKIEEDVRVIRVWCAADVGRVISRDGVLNQIEGGIIQSISWALHEAAPLGARGVEARSWKDYPILHFSETPKIVVRLVGDLSDPPLGAGEIVQGPATAAVANAAASILGARIRRLPMSRDRMIAALSAE